jgi:hypothetical protein
MATSISLDKKGLEFLPKERFADEGTIGKEVDRSWLRFSVLGWFLGITNPSKE